MEQLNVLEIIEKIGIFERKINLALNYAGLRLPHYKALSCLESTGKITVSDLSRALCVTRATTSVLVNQLIKAGAVKSLENRADKRSHYLCLTELGMQRLELARQEVNLVASKISQKFPQDLIRTLNHVAQVIKEEF